MKTVNVLQKISLAVIISILLFLQINNIRLFNTDYGFDGASHKEYISFVSKNHSIPSPNQGWEFNQPPLYYIISSALESIKITPQVINLLLVFLIALVIFIFTKSKIALLSILALPMINYFPPIITNELLGSFFIILCLLLLLKKTNPIVLGVLLSLGFYSKYTIITLLPLVPLSFFLQEKRKVAFKNTLITLGIFCFLVSPLLIRNISLYGKVLPLAPDFYAFESEKQSTNLDFFINLSWIPKMDTFNAMNYSFFGGMWNSFWLDSYHVITPVVSFHKKALILWALGFPLFFISLYGVIKLALRDRKKGIILLSYILIAFLSLIKYYIDLPYNFVLKAFYAFGLIVPYSFGLAEASKGKYLCYVVVALLFIQFIVMVSFFMIQSWWYMVK